MEEKVLYAGYHRLKVTPPMGVDIPGYYEVRLSDGIINDLYIRATAFSDGEKKAIIFSCDSIGIRNEAFQIVKKKIAERCGIPVEAVYITCTHSHTSFRITKPTEELNDNDIFLHRLFQQFADCAQFAFEDLKPATMKIATGSVQGVGFIRRYRMKDGTCKTNPGVGNPDVVGPIGEQDESVQLVRILREGAKEILLINFGTHADVIGGHKYCTDWPGFLVDAVCGAMNNDVEVLTLVGAEGDSNHVNVFRPKGSKRKGVDFSQSMARAIAGEVLKIYDQAKDVPSAKVDYFVKPVKIGKNPYDPADVPEARIVMKIHQEKGKEAKEELKQYRVSVPLAERILENLDRPEFFELQVSALQIGNVAFVGMPGEPFTSIGRAVKEASHMDMTVFTCLTNGGDGYFPDAVAFSEEGYERTASPFAHDCAKILIDAGNEAVSEMVKIEE